MPGVLTTLAHVTVSFLITLANATGVLTTGAIAAIYSKHLRTASAFPRPGCCGAFSLTGKCARKSSAPVFRRRLLAGQNASMISSGKPRSMKKRNTVSQRAQTNRLTAVAD